MKVQWSDHIGLSICYKRSEICQTIKTHGNPFTKKDWAIYIPDNYVVHIMPEIWKTLWGCGYVLGLMGGGITDFI